MTSPTECRVGFGWAGPPALRSLLGRTTRRSIGLAFLSLAVTLAHAGELSPTAKIEIDTLLTWFETSACRFYRNGSWYTGSEAKDHLKTKLDYVVKRDGITTSEEFIDKAATKSIMSGQPYKVRCPNQEEQPSAIWFTNELHRFRSAHGER